MFLANPINIFEILLKDTFLTRERIGKAEEPVLIVHGSDDDYISVEHGKELFNLANDPKELEIIPGGGHSDLWDHGSWKQVRKFLKAHVK